MGRRPSGKGSFVMRGQRTLWARVELAGLLLVAWLALGAGSALADPPVGVSGGISGDNGHFVPISQDGSVVTFLHEDVHELTGDVQGHWDEVGVLVLDLATGEGFFKAVGTFSGTVRGGDPGTATLRVQGEVHDFLVTDRGHFVITHGRGGLAGVHARGTYAYTVGAGGSYDGDAQFDGRP
jgi:hypothetical protein